MYIDLLILFILACAGISLMVYASIFSRRMCMMGEGFAHRVARKILGEEAADQEVAEALEDLRRRFLYLGLALLSACLLLLATTLLLARLAASSGFPAVLAGLAVLCLCAGLSVFMVRRGV